jgi:hypothetical protein
MRCGCTCLVALLLLLAALAGGAWLVVQALRVPAIDRVAFGPADGRRAQEKLFEVVQGRRRGPVTLSDAEINAFLTRHVESAPGAGVADIAVALPAGGVVEVAGRLPLRALLEELPLAGGAQALPVSVLRRSVWLKLRATPVLADSGGSGRSRTLRLEVRDLWLGRLPVPALLARFVVPPGLLRWSVPGRVEEVRIEPGRVVVRLAS